MDFIKGLWRDLRASPVDTLVKWQEQRFLWLFMAVAMGGLIILAHSFFQIYLYMAPCEQCVYIRYAMLVMVFGGVIAAINPKKYRAEADWLHRGVLWQHYGHYVFY
ncbi:disulfide isomerase [Salmonella bongori]|nr:disulfide isomerase [Salmonella bongori]